MPDADSRSRQAQWAPVKARNGIGFDALEYLFRKFVSRRTTYKRHQGAIVPGAAFGHTQIFLSSP